MAYDKLSTFLKILPQDEDYVTPSSANVGPLKNRVDIISIQEDLGDINDLLDEKEIGFDSEEQDKILASNKTNIVSSINKLKSDVNNKHNLKVTSKDSITSAINKIKEGQYDNIRLEEILSRYTVQRRGDFIVNGLNVSYTGTKSFSSWSDYMFSHNYYYVVSSSLSGKTIYTKYIEQSQLNYFISLQNNILGYYSNGVGSDIITFSVSKGKAVIDGRILSIPEEKTLILPSHAFVDSDRVDAIYLSFSSLDELYLDNVWSNEKSYKRSDITYFNNCVYIALTDVSVGSSDPKTDDVKWKYVQPCDAYSNNTYNTFLQYKTGTTTLREDGTYSYTIQTPKHSILLARVVYVLGEEPKVVMNKNAKAFLMSDIQKLESDMSLLVENIGLVQSSLEVTDDESSVSMNGVWTESFFNDLQRDIELEEASGYPSAVASGSYLQPSVEWTNKEFDSLNLQLSVSDEQILIQQTEYTESSLINEFNVSQKSSFVFDDISINFDVNRTSTTVAADVNSYTTKAVRNQSKELSWREYWALYRSNRNAIWYGESVSSSVLNSSNTTSVFNTSKVSYNNQEASNLLNTTKTITLSLEKYVFDSNEKVHIYLDSIDTGLIAYSLYNGSLNSVITFNSGSISLNGVTISKNIYDKTYKLELVGEKSGAIARSSLKVYSNIITSYYTQTTYNNYTTSTWKVYYYVNEDPLAQTFLSSNDSYISKVSVIFDLISTYGKIQSYNSTFLLPDNVTLFIVECTAGLPDNEKILHYQTVLLGQQMNNTSWFDITLSKKIKIQANKYYAMYFTTSDKCNERSINGLTLPLNQRIAMRTCTLGSLTPYTPIKTITNNAYNNGVLFKASNQNTWSAYQNMDLAFKLYNCTFNTQETKTLDKYYPSSKVYTDISFITTKEEDSFTSVNSYVKLSYSDGTSDTIQMQSDEIEYVSNKVLSYVEPSFVLTTTKNSLTPSVNSAVLKLGVVNSQCVYVTKNMNFNKTEAVINKNAVIKFICKENFNQGNIVVQYTTDENITNSSWKTVTMSSSSSNEYSFNCGNLEIYKNFRVRLILKTPDSKTRMKISNLMVYVK